MFDEEMSKQVALLDVSGTNVHQSETSDRQEKCNNAQLVLKRFGVDATRVKMKLRRENRERQ